MYFCAAILVFVSSWYHRLHDILLISLQSYLIGLWFSLRTHASQIWQNPQPLLHPLELPVHNRLSLYQKPSGHTPVKIRSSSLRHGASTSANFGDSQRPETSVSREGTSVGIQTRQRNAASLSPVFPRRVSYATGNQQPGFTPVLESVNHAVNDPGLQHLRLPAPLTTDEFTHAVTVATVSALRHQQRHTHSPGRARASAVVAEGEGGHGGHDAPSWSRTTSASVLLACTALYAVIAGMQSFFHPYDQLHDFLFARRTTR